MILNNHGYFLRGRQKQQRVDTVETSTPTMMSHHFKPDPFAGLPSQDAAAWQKKFQAWLALNEWTDKSAKVANGLRLLLVPPASTWFDELTDETKGDVQLLNAAFKERFINNQPAWVLEQQLWSRVMSPTEGLDSYVTAIDTLCARLQKSNADRIMSFVRGLTPSIRPFVIQQDPKSFSAAVQSARLAQESMAITAGTPVSASPQASLVEAMELQSKEMAELREQLKALKPAQPTVAAAAAGQDTICQLCDKPGHSATTCQTFRRRNVPTCYYCHRRGHVERDCYSKARDQRNGQTNAAQQSAGPLNQPAPSK